ncbi:class I SAM-dependent methyltransferase [soil metagenome]
MAMTDTRRDPSTSEPGPKEAVRRMWGLGDYPKVSREVLGEMGDRLVTSCGIGPGQRVLDVAAGSGNVAIRAARTGAEVVASDLTPALLAAGKQEAEKQGVELEWVEADAEALPFTDGEFDVVTSAVGAMFAPDQRATAAEMLRVLKPGGVLGMANWTPDGSVAKFFAMVGNYGPPPPEGFEPPVLWGSPGHVEDLLGDGTEEISMTKESLDWNFDDPVDLREYYKEHFGPVMTVYEDLGDDQERIAALDRDFLDYALSANLAPEGEAARYELDYLVVLARRSSR